MLKSNKKLSDYNNNSRLVSNSTLKSKSVIKKGKNVINRVSDVQKKRQEKYLIVRQEHLKNFPKCQVCGILDATEIHHPAGRIGNFLYEPLMSVDRNCHMKIHQEVEWAYKNRYLIKNN